MSVAVIIVSYNCRDSLRACLQSLAGTACSLVVVDNASADNTAAMVRADFSVANLIANAENRGFAAACNQGIRATSSDFVLLLNPDATLNDVALQRLLGVMAADSKLGACGPRIHHPDGSLQPSCRRFPTLGVMLCAEIGVKGPYFMNEWPHDSTREVDQLMGSCLLLRRSALEKIGLLDERFFLYFEEVDLCLRLKQAGWKVLFVHDAVVQHIGGASSKSDRRATLLYRYRSLIAFYRKHYPAWHLTALRGVVQIGALARALLGQQHYAAIAKGVWRL